jgi:hypothetical protein
MEVNQDKVLFRCPCCYQMYPIRREAKNCCRKANIGDAPVERFKLIPFPYEKKWRAEENFIKSMRV